MRRSGPLKVDESVHGTGDVCIGRRPAGSPQAGAAWAVCKGEAGRRRSWRLRRRRWRRGRREDGPRSVRWRWGRRRWARRRRRMRIVCMRAVGVRGVGVRGVGVRCVGVWAVGGCVCVAWEWVVCVRVRGWHLPPRVGLCGGGGEVGGGGLGGGGGRCRRDGQSGDGDHSNAGDGLRRYQEAGCGREARRRSLGARRMKSRGAQ